LPWLKPLTQTVSQATLAVPVDRELDPDLVLAKAELNPIVDDGRYFLRLVARPTDLDVIGFANTTTVTHQMGATVRAYSQGLNFAGVADQSWVWVMSPTGEWRRYGRQLWNVSDEEIRPGSLLYIPVDESKLSSDFAGFNQQFMEFLRLRVSN